MTGMTESPRGWTPPLLESTVAVVTGASRGVGRGIALALGEAGAKVYVTGRSVRGGDRTEDLPGTVDDTAEEVTARGGKGVAVRCDHTDDVDTEALFRQIAESDGRIDILVNNAWSGYERWPEARFDSPFWQQPAWRWDLFAGSVRGHFMASRFAVPLMKANGLIVNISFTDGEVFLGQTAYDVFKNASDRMTLGMGHELRKHGICAVALHPGMVITERVEAAWSQLGEGPAAVAHTPEYVGRGIAHLSIDPDLMDLSGQRVAVGDLAAKYHFDDITGNRPPAFKLEGRMTLATRMERLQRSVGAAKAAGGGGQ
jgi:NAD(P)-dependent dehydrogenase (short-subunit alcohol dehydrogenase family)